MSHSNPPAMTKMYGVELVPRPNLVMKWNCPKCEHTNLLTCRQCNNCYKERPPSASNLDDLNSSQVHHTCLPLISECILIGVSVILIIAGVGLAIVLL